MRTPTLIRSLFAAPIAIALGGCGLPNPYQSATSRTTATTAPTASTADAKGPLKVLFVCTANICRSPFMELTARALAPELTISSAGTHGFTAAPMESEMAAVLAEGIDPGEFRSRPLTVDMLAEADLVLTAQASLYPRA